MTEQKDIKILAQLCLDEKWYSLEEENSSPYWLEDCAFCQDALDKVNDTDDPFSHNNCDLCFIKDLPICTEIEGWAERHNKSIIIKALEELAKTGELSEISKDELMS